MRSQESIVFLNTSHLPVNWFYKDLIQGVASLFRIAVAVPRPDLLSCDLPDSIHCYRFSVTRNPSIVRFFLQMPRVLGEIRSITKDYEVIVSNNIVCGLYVAIFRIIFGGRKVWIHWFTGQTWASKSYFVLSPLFWVDMLIYRTAERLVFDSLAQFNFFDGHSIFSADGKDIWVGFSVFGVRQSIKSVARDCYIQKRAELKSLNVSAQCLIHSRSMRFGYVGRISLEKGVFELLLAFENLNRFGLRLQFECWGVADDKKLERSLRNSPFCNYHGEARDVTECFRQIDFLLVPSFREGFGNVVLESSLFGVRSICRDIYGLTDVASFCGSLVLKGDFAADFVEGVMSGRFATSDRDKSEYAQKMLEKYDRVLDDGRLKCFYAKLLRSRADSPPKLHYFLEES